MKRGKIIAVVVLLIVAAIAAYLMFFKKAAVAPGVGSTIPLSSQSDQNAGIGGVSVDDTNYILAGTGLKAHKDK